MNTLFLWVLLCNVPLFAFNKKQSYNGRKIKHHKNKKKIHIKNNIIELASSLKNSESSSKFLNTPPSATAEARYKINNFYVTKNNATKNNASHYYHSNSKMHVLQYLLNNYDEIQIKLNQTLNSTDLPWSNIAFLIFVKYIILGEQFQIALQKTISEVNNMKSISTFNKKEKYDLVTLLEKKKTRINGFQKDIFDTKVIDILKKSLLWNAKNTTETDRVTNRVYNIAKHEPVLLLISYYNQNIFTIKEITTTYGELELSKDIYEKILFKKVKIHNEKEQAQFSALRRNLPDGPAQKHESIILIPEITNNIIEYWTLIKEKDSIKKIKLETFVKNLSKDNFYLFSVLHQKDIEWMLG